MIEILIIILTVLIFGMCVFMKGMTELEKRIVESKNVWHNRSERPKLGEFVVLEELIEGKHKYYSTFRWDRSLEVGYFYDSDITRWAYIEDLLPKGGKI